jgi:uncharacterized protein (TIGR02271 family)
MQNSMTMEQLSELRGSAVYDQSGSKIGSVEEVFYDADTQQPEWIGIGTGFFGMKRVLVPVAGASVTADGVSVPYSKDMVKDTPDVDGDEISEDTERQLYSYYGIPYSDARSDTTMADAGTGTGTVDVDTTQRAAVDIDRTGDDTITRSEEELAVGTRRVETGRLRVRKWVETEPVQAEVTLERESAHIVREPINEVVSGATIGEDSIEVTLEGEEAVVDKRVVAKERIGVDVDREATTQTVSDTVRKERVEVDGDTTTGTTGTSGAGRSGGLIDNPLDNRDEPDLLDRR